MSKSEKCRQEQSVQQITSLVVHSFRLSRGSASLQQEMLVFAGNVLQDSIPESAYDAALEPTIATCRKIFLSPSHHLPLRNEAFSEDQFEQENRTEIGRFVSMLKNSAFEADNYSRIDLPKLMIDDLINTDARWLPWARDAANKRRSLRPYISHIAGHAMLGRNSGSPIFDQMFQTVAVNLPRFFSNGSGETEAYADSFQDVMAGHIDTNPEDESAIRRYAAQNNLPNRF